MAVAPFALEQGQGEELDIIPTGAEISLLMRLRAETNQSTRVAW